MSGAPLIHVCEPHVWRMALAAGELTPASLVEQGFTHLSTPEQLPIPANALFARRSDLLALVVDPARLPGELRWEPGAGPEDPADMRFPHLYGPLPVAAVVAIEPYKPGPDGRFAEPTGLPGPEDTEARVRRFDCSLAQRRAVAVVPVTGGFAALDPRFPMSYEHNAVWIAGAADPATLIADAERVGAKQAKLDDEPTARGLAQRGWSVEDQRLMVYAGPPLPASAVGEPAVIPVAHDVAALLWERSWQRDLPDPDPETIRQLIAREPLADAILRIVNLAVLGPDGAPVASTQLRIDGATAAIEAVMTDPDHRGGGLARALLHDAVARAQAAGCDVIFLAAAADDWPRSWYARFGFADVGARYEATRAG